MDDPPNRRSGSSRCSHTQPYDEHEKLDSRGEQTGSKGSHSRHQFMDAQRMSPSMDPASYIHAAARNIMDERYLEGDDDDDGSSSTTAARPAIGAIREPLSPSLSSLQKKRQPPIPEEQDRKRFVGCLAAVLASTYDYEELELGNDDDLSREEIAAYYAASAADDDDDEMDDDETGDDASGPQLYSSSAEDFDSRVNTTTTSDRTRQSHPSQSHVDYNRTRTKHQEARVRHRKRRYEVLSDLLLSSAEYLHLEKGQVKAFLPILSKLLFSSSNPRHSQRSFKHSHSTSEIHVPMAKLSYKSQPAINAKPLYSAAIHSFTDVGAADFYTHQLDRIEHLRPFLESLTPGAGFRCLVMFLLQHLLTSQEGYDARVRHAIKTLGVLVLVHDMESDPTDIFCSNDDHGNQFPPINSTQRKRSGSRLGLVEMATRRFEALECAVASRLILLSREQNLPTKTDPRDRRQARREKHAPAPRADGLTREELMRGLKVGGTALIAGTLFAVTGGLAAPGIAAGMGLLMGGSAVTAAATAVLTSTAAVTAIFGVGGGGLAAYKMHRRTEGLTEFEFQKESNGYLLSNKLDASVDAELFTTIAISGWLRDEHDFQRPWGLTPTRPRLRDRVELLERFYAVHRPDHVPKCRKILQSWEGEEKELWKVLRDKYGTDPDHLFPIGRGPRLLAQLTLEHEELITELLLELQLVGQESSLHCRFPNPVRQRGASDERMVARQVRSESEPQPTLPSVVSTGLDNERPKHLATAWSFGDEYGGELYTVRWESELLMELCASVDDLALEVGLSSTAQVLKHTALATLMSAIAWPYALVSAANMIDGTWTLAVERADLAGRELARSLLFSKAGRRPVTLIGFSFGARVVYSCLKQLAAYQSNWEEYHATCRSSQRLFEADGVSISYDQLREPASIVEDAILMGLPNHLSLSSWRECRQVVAGRLVNCFSNKDLILSLMFQFKRLGFKPVCGTCPINICGIENFDVSDLIQGHQDYCYVAGAILKRVRLSQPFSSRPTRLFLPEFDKST